MYTYTVAIMYICIYLAITYRTCTVFVLLCFNMCLPTTCH